MTGKRKWCSAACKAKLALEASELTVAQLAAKHGIHQTMINAWKRQAVEGLSEVFSGQTEAAEASRVSEVDRLHAKIGQLVVERDFSGLRTMSVRRRREMIEPAHEALTIGRQC